MTDRPLTPVDPEDLRRAVFYALRYNSRGKAHGVRMRDDPERMADAVVAHLALCKWQVMRGPPAPPHSTGPHMAGMNHNRDQDGP